MSTLFLGMIIIHDMLAYRNLAVNDHKMALTIFSFHNLINNLSEQCDFLGGMQDSLNHSLNELGITIENLTNVKMRI